MYKILLAEPHDDGTYTRWKTNGYKSQLRFAGHRLHKRGWQLAGRHLHAMLQLRDFVRPQIGLRPLPRHAMVGVLGYCVCAGCGDARRVRICNLTVVGQLNK